MVGIAVAQADQPKKDSEAPKAEKAVPKDREAVSVDAAITIDGKPVEYTVTTDELVLKDGKGKARASIFHVSYIRTDLDNSSERPVIFAFNGGPGSSAVWLHLGILGPYRVEMPGDGTTAPAPPSQLIPNEFSILDVADLVFVDPVSTGYSRAEDDVKPSEFHGVREDITSLGDFIRRWVTENKRWDSPKYLLGESYGGIRVAGLSNHLQSRYGMTLNGTILLSSLLDFRTLRGGDGDPLSYAVFMPSYTAVALHHGKLKGDKAKLMKEAEEFAFNDYLSAMLKGNALPKVQKQAVADRLSELTAIDAKLIMDLDLRLNSSRFRSELLREEGKVVGRFDARVAWPTRDTASDYPEYDPSFSLAYGAYSTAMLTYLSTHLDWQEDRPYEILTGKVHPWNWSAENRTVNVSDDLTQAMRDNPHLRVLVMEADCDLATPYSGMRYTIRQMVDAPESILSRIEHTRYDAGHMFYTNLPDLKKARKDLVEFINK